MAGQLDTELGAMLAEREAVRDVTWVMTDLAYFGPATTARPGSSAYHQAERWRCARACSDLRAIMARSERHGPAWVLAERCYKAVELRLFLVTILGWVDAAATWWHKLRLA